MPLSSWMKRTILIAAMMIIPSSALAGERLQLDELVARSDAIAEVTVELATGESQDRIADIKMLTIWPWPDEIQASPEWIGRTCLPSRKLIADRWLVSFLHFPSVPLWRAALKEGRYHAVIFLSKKKKEQLRPVCEIEAMLAENWLSHPEHAAWRTRLFDLIDHAKHLQRRK